MMITGIASLFVLISGVGIATVLHIPFSTGWLIVKIFCWLMLSSLAGVVYRRAHLRGVLSLVGLVLILVAVYMVYFRPF